MGGALHRIFHTGIRAVFVVVVGGQLIGNEHGIKQPPLHRAGHVLPVGRTAPVPVNFVFWVSPHASGMAVNSMLNKTEKMRFLFCGHVGIPVVSLIEIVLGEIASGMGVKSLMLHHQH